MTPRNNPAFLGGLRRTLAFADFPIPADVERLLSEPSFDEFTHLFEMKTHAWIHRGIGGHMGNLHHSPNDPAFWLHHANVDRIWARWQRGHPFEDARMQTAYGNKVLPPTASGAGARRWTFAEACRVNGTLVAYPDVDEWPPA
jgi:hypothetical protein